MRPCFLRWVEDGCFAFVLLISSFFLFLLLSLGGKEEKILGRGGLSLRFCIHAVQIGQGDMVRAEV